MARKALNMTVRVLDIGVKEDKRCLEIGVESQSSIFSRSDFCASEGLIAPLSKLLEQRVKETLIEYSRSGQEFLEQAKGFKSTQSLSAKQ